MAISLKFMSSCLALVCGAPGIVLGFSDSKSKGWEKIGKVSLESCSQILEETLKNSV